MCEDKIVVIGVKLCCWVSFYGILVNVELDLGYYDGIVFCGIVEYGVISFVDLGYLVELVDLDVVLMWVFVRNFLSFFG